MARWITWWTSGVLLCASGALGGDTADTKDINGTRGDPPPAHSMHRLIPSVLDTFSDSSSQLTPVNTSNTKPFLPMEITTPSQGIQTLQKEFTPSYFIGEVIAEPYVPERFKTSKGDNLRRNSTNRSYQNPVGSQTALAFNKILPFFEKMKEASIIPPDDHSYDYVPPVHEPSAEEEDSTSPKNMLNYAEHDEHSDRPLHPYHFEQNLFVKKPNSFEDNKEDTRQEIKKPNENHGYPDDYRHHDHRSTPEGYHGHVPHNVHQGLVSGYHDPYLGGAGIDPYPFKGNDPSDISNIPSEPHYDDLLHHHGPHDFVLPSPFYPSGPEHNRHKGISYNVFQNKPKSGLHGLLHLAATLVPLGLLFVALQPSIIQVNASQPMPMRQRSLDSLDQDSLEVLQRLHHLQGADCRERVVFCEEAVKGGLVGASSTHQAFWNITNRLSDLEDSPPGLAPLLRAVRDRSCTSLRCGQVNNHTNATNTT